jgi:hypothetical protein
LVYLGLFTLLLAQQSCADPQGPASLSRSDAPTAPSAALSLSTAPAPGSTLTSLVLTPATASLHKTAGFQFTLSAKWSDGSSSVPAVTWTATGGTINSTGRYIAGATVGTFRVIATQQGGSMADTSVVKITSLVKLDLTPAAATLQPGATLQFKAMGTRSDGTVDQDVVDYSATGGTITTGGTLSTDGRYTAGSTVGTFRVIAVHRGGTMADTSTVTIAATTPVLQAVILTPTSTSVVTGGTKQCTVSGKWSNGATTAPSVAYTATGGTISSAGLYQAGATPGSYRVIAKQTGGTLADTALVSVTPATTSGTGNLANMTFESGGFESLTDGGGGAPVNGKIVTSGAYSGTHAFDISVPASSTDQGGSGYWLGGQQYTDLWVSFALKVIASPNQGLATQKMVIFRSNGNAPNQFGEMNQMGGLWVWNWLYTDPAKGTIYLTSKLGTISAGLGQWHTYKIHLQSHGTTTVTFGKDGVDNLITLTTTAAPAGIPTTLTFGGTLNGGSGASHFQFDNIHIGTSDPGWP